MNALNHAESRRTNSRSSAEQEAEPTIMRRAKKGDSERSSRPFERSVFNQDPGILARRQMLTAVKSARPQILEPEHLRIGYPAL